MNHTPEQLMIGKRLRDLSASWIRSLRDTLQMFATLPPTHPNYPLPSDFPFSTTSLKEKIHWIEAVGSDAIPYRFNVRLEYYIDTSHDWSPAIWVVRSSAMSVLGRVEVDYRILADRESPLTISSDFVLEMMVQSLLREQPLRLSSRVTPNSNPVVYPGLVGNIEMFELRTLSGMLIMEVARRIVAIRRCSVCDHFLPPVGPSACIAHLLPL
ncbi:hypothetical protein P691DRAFT_151912 [Macrolepiota fuliginosa MF-IS2]|uniref:Uncharacterized protein n=1 Tax=Macrolepiota fuliginosa MF-IS2 TaxID=1400762 RepID=A0A9P5X9K9_9AGAR|nr:hypothetical protein P691DRAFT_151912 [Macrolepiota fuliginosa MF-IS2]